MEILSVKNVSKKYGQGTTETIPVKNISLNVERGDFMAIVGPSGSGKTTLLNIMSGLDHPSEGEAWFSGTNIATMGGDSLADFRRDHIGFIFQSYNLIPVLTVYENIEYTLNLQGIPKSERQKKVKEILINLGLSEMEHRFPLELSGGQQQRVAIARAIITNPQIVFADEPTANLDSTTADKLIQFMKELNRKSGITFVFSTHDNNIMQAARRIVSIKDGKILNDIKKDEPSLL